MSSTQIIVLTLLLFTASTLDYFQLRSVYSVGNPRDSICYYLGWQEADDIHLNFNIDGFELKQFDVSGNTVCAASGKSIVDRISIVKEWKFISSDNENQVQFKQEPIYQYKGEEIQSIKINTTLVNPSIINNLPYHCVIYGDGKVNHFGVRFVPSDPSQLYIKCDAEVIQQ